MEHIKPAVWIELGRIGLSDTEAHALIGKAGRVASKQHQIGAEGRVPVPNSKRVLVYNGGIDGMDWTVRIEDEPVKTAHDLVQEIWTILDNHGKLPASSYGGGGPYTRDWQHDAARYLDAEAAQAKALLEGPPGSSR